MLSSLLRWQVTLGNVPVGESPYTACICNPTIAFPSSVAFAPLEGDSSGLPEGLRSCDMVKVHDLIVLLKSAPRELTGNREREVAARLEVTQPQTLVRACLSPA